MPIEHRYFDDGAFQVPTFHDVLQVFRPVYDGIGPLPVPINDLGHFTNAKDDEPISLSGPLDQLDEFLDSFERR